MRKWIALVSSVVLGASLLLGMGPANAATTDLGPRYVSASLRENSVGYSLRLTPADSGPGNAYTGVLRFHFQDGRRGKPIKVGIATTGSGVGMKVAMVLPGGSLASGKRVLTGTLGEDGSFTFLKCAAYLPHVTKATAPDFCMFQPF
jgi:hypothetical protein